MSACIPNPCLTISPAARGRIVGSALGVTLGVFRLPTDPVGVTNVLFDGVAAGSEIRVYDQDLNELAGIESCSANQVLTWSVYASGSPKNSVTIKIINMAYRIKDFPYVSQLGSLSIPIQMEADKWFSNPA